MINSFNIKQMEKKAVIPNLTSSVISFKTGKVEKINDITYETIYIALEDFSKSVLRFQNSLKIKEQIDIYSQELKNISNIARFKNEFVISESLQNYKTRYKQNKEEVINYSSQLIPCIKNITPENHKKLSEKINDRNIIFSSVMDELISDNKAKLSNLDIEILKKISEYIKMSPENMKEAIDISSEINRIIDSPEHKKNIVFNQIFKSGLHILNAQSMLHKIIGENGVAYLSEIALCAQKDTMAPIITGQQSEIKSLPIGQEDTDNDKILYFNRYVEKIYQKENEKSEFIADLLIDIGSNINKYTKDIMRKTDKRPSIASLFKKETHMVVCSCADSLIRSHNLNEDFKEVHLFFSTADKNTINEVYTILQNRKHEFISHKKKAEKALENFNNLTMNGTFDINFDMDLVISNNFLNCAFEFIDFVQTRMPCNISKTSPVPRKIASKLEFQR